MFSIRSFYAILVATVFGVCPQLAAAAVLAGPSPLAPSAYITDTTPDFAWSLVEGASSYELALMDENDAVVYFSQAGIDNPPFNIAGAVFDQSKVYHWKVRAAFATGELTPWSDVESFLIFDPNAVPKTLGPAGYIQTSLPAFSWTEADGAVNYDLIILNDAETVTVNYFGSLEGTSFQNPESMPLPANKIYHYKVRSRAANGTVSIWSDPNSFLVYRATDVPQLLGPNVQAPMGMTNFSWMPVEAAMKYEFQMMNESEDAVIISDSDISVNGYAPKAAAQLENGVVYHWKVRSILGDGSKSLWSQTNSFAFYDPSLVPDSIMPFGYITSSRPLLEWSQVNGAASYQVQLLDSVSQQILASVSVVNDTRLDIGASFKLKSGLSYDWRVRALMADGRVSVWSPHRAFRTAKDIWSGLVGGMRMSVHFYPAQIVTMSWTPLSLDGITGLRYHVILRAQPADGPFATLWSGDANPANPSTLTIPSDVYLRPGTPHAWVVQAYNVDGLMIGESRKYTFKTPAEVPARYQDQIAALQASQALDTEALVVSQAKVMSDLVSAQSAKVAAVTASQASAFESAKQKLVAKVASLRVSQAAALAALAKSQAAGVASLQKSQDAASASLAKSQATTLANLDRSAASAVAALKKSQASALAALKKVKGVTAAQIEQFVADQAATMSDFVASQAPARAAMMEASVSAAADLATNQQAARDTQVSAQAAATASLQETQSAALSKAQVDGDAASMALQTSQSAYMAKIMKSLQAAMTSLTKRQGQQLQSLALKQQSALNKLLRAQEAELMRTR